MIHFDFEFEFNGQKGRVPGANLMRVMAAVESGAITGPQVFVWGANKMLAQITAVAKGVEILCMHAGVRGVKQEDLVIALRDESGRLSACLDLLAALMVCLRPPENDDDTGNAKATPEASPQQTTPKAS